MATKKVESVECAFEWTISKFSSLETQRISHEWTFGERTLELTLLPRKVRDGEDFVSLYLYHTNTPRTKLQLHLSIINMFNEHCNKFTENGILYYETISCDEFIRRKDLVAKGLLINDELRISCKVTFENHWDVEKVIEPTDLCHKLGEMDISHIEFDTQVIVNNHVFDVHRFVLSQCQVFAAMFRHDMNESITNSITIDDYEPAVFREFLRYLYTNQIEDMDVTGYLQLYMCAEKYAVAELKTVCERELRLLITVDNVVEILLFTDTYNVESLKRDALKFIANMASRVAATSGWKKIVSNPLLTEEVLNELAKCIPTVKLAREI
ncbi:hypothetical protein GE061_000582 [Apolygus lucorum]|uniref:BTB domain-containing protein n=1 Tax=Apolygus lucorum TaxID=248454 RepID=A0A6A4KMB5_APOLU|nr:hypothetical protein GE061_000582 [Apolygus lucorum]